MRSVELRIEHVISSTGVDCYNSVIHEWFKCSVIVSLPCAQGSTRNFQIILFKSSFQPNANAC